MKKKEVSEFGIWLKETRKRLGLSILDLVKITGITKSGIYQIETGISRNVRLDTVQIICDSLGIDYTIESKTKMKGVGKNEFSIIDEIEMFNTKEERFTASLNAQQENFTKIMSNHFNNKQPCD